MNQGNVDALPGAGGLDLGSRASYPLWSHEVLRFSDTDAVGHINNGAYSSCFETARIKMLARLGPIAGEGGVNWVLARLCIDFHDQLFYPGEVDVGTRIVRVGRSSLGVAQGLFDGAKCCGSATGVLVLIDLASGKATPIPEATRQRIGELMSG